MKYRTEKSITLSTFTIRGSIGHGYGRHCLCQDVHFLCGMELEYIVMKHLDFPKGMKGSRKQKFHHWRHRFIVQKMEYKAHRNGMRFSIVNAWNPSRLSFDGSGKVRERKRNPEHVVQYRSEILYLSKDRKA